MGRLDLATGLIVVLLLLQGLPGSLSGPGLLGDVGFQRLQPQPEVLQTMAQPDTANATGRDKDPRLRSALRVRA